MNLQGKFEGQNLTGIFQMLYNDQCTGFLRVTSDEKESRVFFDQGTIIYASSSLKKTRLGFLMVHAGAISKNQLKESLAAAKTEKLSLGKILVDRGHISLQTLEKFTTKQVEEIIYDLLFWKKGDFEYKDAKINLKGMIATQLNPMKLILEASRRMDEMSVLYETIPSDRIVFKISAQVENKEEFKLNANEWKVLSLIDGTRTVRHLIQESGYDETAVYKILFSVISYGLIQKKDEVQLSDSSEENEGVAIINVFDDILQAVMKGLHNELGVQAVQIFEEAKFDLDPVYQTVLKTYHPENNKVENITIIIDTLKEYKGNYGRFFLIEAFAFYCIQILTKTHEILGSYPLQNILNDVTEVINYIKKYQEHSVIKNKIIEQMRQVFDQVTSL